VNSLTVNRSVRGPSMKICVLDEVAFWHSENSAKPDEETYRALRPGLARVPGSMLIGISSPYRKSGLLYIKWKQFYGRNDPDVLVIQAPSRTLNPTINQAEIDRDMENDQARRVLSGWPNGATTSRAGSNRS
jgi:hypothetical protein